MDAENQNFDTLRRALALKRHEAPPPRYFNELPGRVLSRLSEPQQTEPVPFFVQLKDFFTRRPILSTGAGVCAGFAGLGLLALTFMQEAEDHGASFAIKPAAISDQMAVPNPQDHSSLFGSAPIASTNEAPVTDIFNQFKVDTAPVSVPVSPLAPQ
jgi:hypothetical protein